MSGHGAKQPRQEEAAISALLACPTITEAAERAGIGEATMRRWLADEGFAARYRRARHQVLSQAVSGLQQAAGKAVGVLVTIAEDATAPHAARVSAAKTILDQAFRGTEVLDLAAEIAELKRQRAETDSNGA